MRAGLTFVSLSLLVLVGCGGTSAVAPPPSGSAGTGGSAAGAAGAAAPPCGLRVASVKAIDPNGDGYFETGEQKLTVQASVENTTASAAGAVVLHLASDDPRVVPDGGGDVRLASIAAGATGSGEVVFSIPKQVWSGSEIGFSATARLEDDQRCTAPAVEPYVVTMGTPEELAMHVCDATRQLVLSDPQVTPADAGDAIAPGANLELEVRMTNPGPLDANWYPSALLNSDNRGVRVTSFLGVSGLYVLGAGMSGTLHWSLAVDASVPHGTTAHLTASATPAQTRCRNPPKLEIPFLVP